MIEKNNIRGNLLNHNLLNIELSDDISNKLNELLKDKIVCTYIPIKTEINVLASVSDNLTLNTVFLKGNTLEICRLSEPFIKNEFGVLEPEEPVIKNDTQVFLVPGVAFTPSGHRLGRGGGYYDKLLEQFPQTTKIGICHDFQVVSSLPTEDHDISMDYVFTNINYYKSSA